MPTYKEMYFTLARAQRDAILILQGAHQKAEEMLFSDDVPDHLRVIRSAEQPDIRCLNFSARTYNALDQWFGEHGRDYIPTIKDILSIKSYRELMKIRNLGEKSYFELVTKMQEAGYTDWAEEMSNQLDRQFKKR